MTVRIPAPRRDDATALPALSVALGLAALCAMDALIKTFGTSLPIVQIVFLRYLVGTLVAAPVFLATGPHRITRDTIRTNGLRAAFMLVAAAAFFYAITRLPLVEAVTLSFTAPLFVVVVARLILGEAMRAQAFAGVALGLAGMAVVVAGDAGSQARTLTPDGIAAALLAAVAYAFGMVLLRKHSASTPIPVMIGVQSFLSTLMIAPLALWFWVPVGRDEMSLFAVIGFLGTTGHLFMAWGFARAEAGRLAPIEYTAFIWAAIFGFLLFGEVPALATYAGAAIIIAACAIATRPGWPIYPRRRFVRTDERSDS